MRYMTTQRKQLYEFLRNNPHNFFTAKEIEDALTESGTSISISAIYRNLSALLKMGAIEKALEQSDKETSYRYINSDSCKNEIHITCSSCGKMFHMEHSLAENIQKQLMSNNEFQIDMGKTVVSGICKECKQKAENKE